MNFNPRILADNFFRRSGVVVTNNGAAAGFPASRLFDGIDWLAWKPDDLTDKEIVVDMGLGNDTAPEAWGVLGHNGGDETVTFKIRHSDTSDTGPWTDLDSYAPANNEDFMRALDGSQSHRYWSHISESIDALSFVTGEKLLGEAIKFPNSINWPGFDPQFERPVRSQQRNAEGHVIGVQLDYSAREQQWNIPLLPDSFLQDLTVNTGWRWFWNEFGRTGKPAAFLWNADETAQSHQHDLIWGQVDEFFAGLQTPLDTGFRAFSMKISGNKSGTEL